MHTNSPPARTPSDADELPGESTTPREPRWWRTLSFRLGAVINVTAIVVLGSFWVLDYQREWATHVDREAERLREEGRVLAAARAHLTDNAEFAEFVDTFCRQMRASVSPDHHIMVIGGNDSVIASSRAHTGHALEAELLRRPHAARETFEINDVAFLSVAVPAQAERIIITQSLRNISEIIRSQSLSRLASLALLATVLFGITTLALLVWVRDPLRTLAKGVAEIGRRRFGVRTRPKGSAELRYLAIGFNQMAAALEAVDKERESQMRRARDIQSRLLPRTHQVRGCCDVTVHFEPAEGVGGDFYDIVPVGEDSTLITVLDVSGHGVAPALYTALLRTVLRHESRLDTDPGHLLESMNREFADVAVHSGDFATCFLCRIDAQKEVVEYASAGHEPGLLITSQGEAESLSECGTPLGVSDTERYVTGTVEFRPGARLLLYTDGLHEAANVTGELYGRERLFENFASTRLAAPSEQVLHVVSSVRAFTASRRFLDDVTLLCVQRTQVGASPGIRMSLAESQVTRR